MATFLGGGTTGEGENNKRGKSIIKNKNYFNASNSSLERYSKYPSSSKYLTTEGNPDLYLLNLSTLSLDNNKFTDIKGLESLTSLIEITLGLLRHKKLGIISGFNLNGKIIPRNIARKMGIRHSPGDAISRASVYIRAKKMVKYCQFVKNTGNVDCTTPGIVDVYNQWKKYH